MARIDAVVIGAGNRGRFTFGAWAVANPERLRVVAVAEPVAERRLAMAREHGLGAEALFDDWREALAGPARAPVAIIATGDTLHVEPALAALEAGYHVLLEKPIAPTPVECLRVVEAAERSGRILQIGHVLRYTAFYEKVAEVLRSGLLGDLVHLDMKEHVAFWHFDHSYVRGKFRSREIAAPLVLAKACHDLDLLVWFADRAPLRVASFGSLGHFASANAPEGAPARCVDGCPVRAECPHDAVRFYLGPDDELAKRWPWADLGGDPSREARRAALASGPYGRCVYRCDNDVADRQVLAIEFDGGLTASFTVHGHASEERRTLRATGTRGELRGVFQDGLLELTRHGEFGVDRIPLGADPQVFGHHGGDGGLLDHFTRVVAGEGGEEIRASGRVSLASHLLGFAAEQARLSGSVVELDAFEAQLAPGP